MYKYKDMNRILQTEKCGRLQVMSLTRNGLPHIRMIPTVQMTKS